MHKNDVTIIVPTSYIPSHPSLKVIETTINNTRFHFPNNEIILQIDGIRSEQLEYKKDYDEYKNKVLRFQNDYKVKRSKPLLRTANNLNNLLKIKE